MMPRIKHDKNKNTYVHNKKDQGLYCIKRLTMCHVNVMFTKVVAVCYIVDIKTNYKIIFYIQSQFEHFFTTSNHSRPHRTHNSRGQSMCS